MLLERNNLRFASFLSLSIKVLGKDKDLSFHVLKSDGKVHTWSEKYHSRTYTASHIASVCSVFQSVK